MRMRLGFIVVLFSTAAAAQTDVRADVRSALEEQLPVPSQPLVLPRPAPVVPEGKGVDSSQIRRGAAESARVRADEAIKPGRGRALEALPGNGNSARGKLGPAAQSATGQARADEVRKNGSPGKPPRPPKP